MLGRAALAFLALRWMTATTIPRGETGAQNPYSLAHIMIHRKDVHMCSWEQRLLPRVDMLMLFLVVLRGVLFTCGNASHACVHHEKKMRTRRPSEQHARC